MRILPKVAVPSLAVLLLATGCGGSTGASSSGSPTQGSASSSESSSSPAENPTPTGASESAPAGPGSLTVTTGDGEQQFTPNVVHCASGDGSIRHLMASVDNQPPLLKVEDEGGLFVMYKPQQQGRPYKAKQPEGIQYTADGIKADHANVGGATINGQLHCTDGV
ncbi:MULTISPECIES: hypothetical protein [Micrococcaceae]|uniref:hypothetical protein n=1 Tax=unclassified Kocuria TaxID=2649579 RepID=UPI001011997D|nr:MULTISPECIES: hypothetical protein [unclassified Kocuria]